VARKRDIAQLFAIHEPNGDALTGCWLVGSGKAPEERALILGETVGQTS
jgi:hypothetical protein